VQCVPKIPDTRTDIWWRIRIGYLITNVLVKGTTAVHCAKWQNTWDFSPLFDRFDLGSNIFCTEANSSIYLCCFMAHETCSRESVANIANVIFQGLGRLSSPDRCANQSCKKK
jgi:hypothetical protein